VKVYVSIATKGDRPEQLNKTIASIKNQCDELFLYDNSQLPDLTDMGKFYLLHQLSQPCYYLTIDDDIIYPTDYVDQITSDIDHYGTIITYHGRILKQPIKRYYQGHDLYDFRHGYDKALFVDVGGTGVMGFRTDYFNPVEVYKTPYKCMSDIVVSLEAKRQNKKIICAPKEKGWLIQQEVESSILKRIGGKDESKQVELCKLIFE
jgi:hypothetical protein